MKQRFLVFLAWCLPFVGTCLLIAALPSNAGWWWEKSAAVFVAAMLWQAGVGVFLKVLDHRLAALAPGTGAARET